MRLSQTQSCSDHLVRSSWGKYILAGIIGALVAGLAISVFSPSRTLALSQIDPGGADGVFAVQAQLSSNAYGIYLIDTRNQTILLYTYGGPWARGFRLLSARSFRYDRELLDFNSGKPSPREVQELIESASEAPEPSKAGVLAVPEVGEESKPTPEEPVVPE